MNDSNRFSDRICGSLQPCPKLRPVQDLCVLEEVTKREALFLAGPFSTLFQIEMQDAWKILTGSLNKLQQKSV